MFCLAIESLDHIWANGDEWMEKSRNKSCHKLDLDELEELALAKLEDINKLARERLFDTMDEDEQERGDCSPPSNSKSFFPGTPTSVLPEITHISSDGIKINVSSPSLFHLRVQAVGKLNPIDVKRLSFHMFPHVATKDLNFTIQNIDPVKDVQRIETIYDFVVEQTTEDLNDQCSDEMLIDTPKVQEKEATDSDGFLDPISAIKKDDMDVISPPASLERLHPNVTEKDGIEPVAPPSPRPLQTQSSLVYSNNSISSPIPPHLPSISSKDTNFSPAPPSLPVLPFGGQIVAPLPMGTRSMVPPPPPLLGKGLLGKGGGPPPPPPIGKGGPPPPPPIGKGGPGGPPLPPGLAGDKNLRPKKVVTKLKRSPQMANLYRLLKGKIEGSCFTGKTQGKGKTGAPAGGKTGMADALAEMTKRSAYYMQIEADVKTHAQAIREVKVAISSFQTLDMAELIKFHKYVESRLEKLADESQVLARFEDFPTKKLEALRMSAALYSKLEVIVQTLQNWQIVSPVNQVVDKIEKYFTKIKSELDALERTKDEEAKRFQAHKITFDFSVLIRIKELMVDVSSSCMELALKEKREVQTKEVAENINPKKLSSDGKKNGSRNVMWKAFQFAYRVYSFAGGHDDRADMLTRELAQEIETDDILEPSLQKSMLDCKI